MRPRLILIAALTGTGCFAAALPMASPFFITQARAECDPGTRIDRTTVENIRAKLVKAGYQNPLHLRKGCDNAWHGTATRAGQAINVAVLPDGHIVEDGD